MATIAAGASDRATAERKFYSRMAWLVVALVFIGFAPSFYLRGLVHVPRPNPTLPPSVMIHGTLFTLWVLAFVAQTQLISFGRRDLHMKLGLASFCLALLILPMMYLVAVWQVARANQAPFSDPYSWTFVPIASIPVYATLLYLGWTRRRQAAWHKRAMLCAMLVLADPALGRFPIAPPVLLGHVALALLAYAVYIPLVLHDRRTLGHLHPVTRIALPMVAAMLVARIAMLATGAWAPIAHHLPGVGS